MEPEKNANVTFGLDHAKRLVQEDKSKRAQRCMEKIQKVLNEEECTIVPKITVTTDGRIEADISVSVID